MLKELAEYIVGLKAPHTMEVEGKLYTDKDLRKVVNERYAKAIELTTLSSLVEYIKSGVDTMKGKMIVHVETPTRVVLYSQLDEDRRREDVAVVYAQLPEIVTNSFVDREKFNIALQSKFVSNPDRDVLLKFISVVEDGTVQEYGDDGVSQKATVKQGIASKTEALVPNPVVLKPYRTFTEVDQPESAFVFRMKSGDGIACALYEADGGAWKREAMENVKEFLKEELAGVEGYTVIS